MDVMEILAAKTLKQYIFIQHALTMLRLDELSRVELKVRRHHFSSASPYFKYLSVSCIEFLEKLRKRETDLVGNQVRSKLCGINLLNQ